MKWLNPFSWVVPMGAYAREHFVAWNVSTVLSWGKAWALSLTFPFWARDLWVATEPIVEEAHVMVSAFASVIRDFFLNSS